MRVKLPDRGAGASAAMGDDVARIELYRDHAERYERLVSREDHRKHLIPALNSIAPLAGVRVVEPGAGTGRMTCALAPAVREIRAFDLLPQMLDVAVKKAEARGFTNCRFSAADNRSLPVEDGYADLALEAWSLAQMAVWAAESWREALRRAVDEMVRVTRSGGWIVLIETLGTLEEKPNPPERLRPFYSCFEEEMGFRRKWIRTDYRFADVEEAVDLIGFFFGGEMARIVRERRLTTVPECTGLWYRRGGGRTTAGG